MKFVIAWNRVTFNSNSKAKPTAAIMKMVMNAGNNTANDLAIFGGTLSGI